MSISLLFKDLIKFYHNFALTTTKPNSNLVISVLPEELLKNHSKKDSQNRIAIHDPFDNFYDPGSRNSFKINDFLIALEKSIN